MEKEGIYKFLKRTLYKILKRILAIERNVRIENFYLEAVLFFLFLIWGFSFLDEAPSPQDRLGGSDSFLHNINLVFHEAGHVFFSLFGNRFLTVLGGSLLQCLIPLIVMIHFLRQKNNFSASIMFWWFGQNFIDLAPYVYDAYDQVLILLGGVTGRDMPGYHDWHYLLTEMNLLEHYSVVALLVNGTGKIILLLSFLWSFIILYQKYLFLKSKKLNI